MSHTHQSADQPISILLVEADLGCRERLYDLLVVRHGYTVFTASSAAQAIELFKHDRPQLVLASDQLSECSAGEFIRRIRAFDAITPIILLWTPPSSDGLASAAAPMLLDVQAIVPRHATEETLLPALTRCLQPKPAAQRERWPGLVLVVDDEPKLRALLADFLTLRGFRVRTVTSGDQALTVMADDLPTTVLLDIRMAGMDGLLTLKKMKASYPTVSVIMITGVEEEDSVQQALALGASDYITKPFDFEYLETTLLSKLVLGRKPT